MDKNFAFYKHHNIIQVSNLPPQGWSEVTLIQQVIHESSLFDSTLLVANSNKRIGCLILVAGRHPRFGKNDIT